MCWCEWPMCPLHMQPPCCSPATGTALLPSWPHLRDTSDHLPRNLTLPTLPATCVSVFVLQLSVLLRDLELATFCATIIQPYPLTYLPQ
jgi:hypothetical protein